MSNDTETTTSEKIIDFLVTMILMVPLLFLFKYFLMEIGGIWEIETFANLSWHDYWGYSGIAALYLSGTAARVALKEDKEGRKFPGITRSITYGLSMLFIYWMTLGIHHFWFA